MMTMVVVVVPISYLRTIRHPRASKLVKERLAGWGSMQFVLDVEWAIGAVACGLARPLLVLLRNNK